MTSPTSSASGAKKRRIDPAAKRERIITAARQVFAEKAYEEASVSEIVKRAGVAQGTFYRYFPSKTHLVSALAEQINDEVAAEIATVLDEGRPLSELLEPLILAASRVMDRNRDALSVVDTEALLFGASSEAERRREPYYRLLASLIERDKRKGLLDPQVDPYVAARLAGSVMDRLARDSFAGSPEILTERYVAQAVGFLRRALGAKT